MEPIYAYTKADAVADGEQMDISGMAEAVEAGFRVPVYITGSIIKLIWPEEMPTGQDSKGRLWDLCYLAIRRVRVMKIEGDESGPAEFTVRFQQTGDKVEDVRLWICFNCAEGFTIMKPEEY